MQSEKILSTDTELLRAIYDKLNSIEERITKTESLLCESQNIIATTVDTFDSLALENNINHKLENLTTVIKKVATDESIDRITNLVIRLEEFLPLIEKFDFISLIIDIADDYYKTLKNSGVELSSVITEISKLLPAFTDPKVFELLNKILENKDNLLKAIETLNSLPSAINIGVDIFDEYASVIKYNPKLSFLKESFQEVKEEVISANQISPENIGILDILKLLNDKNVRKNIFVALSAFKSVTNKI